MSSDGMIFYYGSYKHPKGEVYPASLEVRPRFTSDGVRWASDLRMQVKGSFVNQNPELDAAGVNDRIEALEQVYRFDYRDAGFLFSDETPTQHFILTDDGHNLSGNRVLHRSWDNVAKTEFANTRSFSVVIGALVLDTYSDIIYFKESTTRIGDGGPSWKLYNNWQGDPIKEFVSAQTKVYHVQEGVIDGLFTWPTAPAPYWPNEELTWRRVIRQTSPRLHGHPSNNKPTHYRTEYRYEFERIGPDSTQRPSIFA